MLGRVDGVSPAGFLRFNGQFVLHLFPENGMGLQVIVVIRQRVK
jgi:hypothetical protein